MWRCLWLNYPYLLPGWSGPPFALNMSEWAPNILFLLAQFPWWRLMKMLCKKVGQGVHFSVWPACVSQHWVCVWLTGTVVFQPRPGSFSSRAALFIQWVKFVPQYSSHKHIVPCISAMLDTTQLCSFLQRWWPHHNSAFWDKSSFTQQASVYVYFVCFTMLCLWVCSAASSVSMGTSQVTREAVKGSHR